MRDDLQLISDWIPADASLLDLGCGDGTLLAHLKQHKQIRGYGLEINQDNLAACFEKGVNVLEQDLDEGLGNFQNHRFDYVVMTQALQAVLRPDQILNEMLRVHAERAALKRNNTVDEVGDAALFLCSPLSRGITGEVIYCDAGYRIMGM